MKKVIRVMVIAIIIFPICINLIMFAPFSLTTDSLNQKDWLSFWGSYGGGVIGGVGALLSVLFTIKYYREKDDEQRKMLNLASYFEKLKYLQQQIENREIIRDESISKLDFTDDAKEKIKEYNKLTYSLKGFFSEQAIGTLIGVFQLENDKGETHHYHSTLNYFKLPEEIRKYAEIIANLSLI